MIPKTIADLILILASVFGIEKYDHSKTLVENVPDFDKVDELMTIITIENHLGQIHFKPKGSSLTDDQIKSLKDSGFSMGAITDIYYPANDGSL